MPQHPERRQETFTLTAPDFQRLTAAFGSTSFLSDDRRTLLHKFLQQAIALINSGGAIYFIGRDQAINSEVSLLSRQMQALGSSLEQKMADCATDALEQERTCYKLVDEKASIFCISCPLPQDKGCLSVLLVTENDSLSPFLLTLQLLAALLDQHLKENPSAKISAPQAPAGPLFDQLVRIFSLPPGKERLQHLNQSLKLLTGADLCAMALVSDTQKGRLAAVSDVASFDQRTEPIRLLQKGVDECILRNTSLCWPEDTDRVFRTSLVLEEIGRSHGGARVVTQPLASADGTVQAVLLLIWNTAAETKESLLTLQGYSTLLSELLPGLTKSSKVNANRLSRLQAKTNWSLQQKVTAAVAAVFLMLLFLPVPYRLAAEAVVRPKIARFVVSRYDGLLEKTMVRPGDAVTTGKILARLDGREVEVERAALQAELDKARKMRDQATALGNIAAAQVARLDALRYEQQVTRLQERLNHLTIISPVDGIVLSGDLQRAEGSPVSRGQTLFEVAPLANMDVEVTIAEETISRVHEQAQVKVRFDAYPDALWQKEFSRIEPKAQLRNNRNVFIGVLEFDNPDNKLRPGMQGKATIHVGTKSLGWIIFHKPWYTLLRLLDTLL